MKRVFTIKATATMLGISRRTLARLIEVGKVHSIRLSERRRGIPATEIDRILKEGIRE